jgi:hypothetical protein
VDDPDLVALSTAGPEVYVSTRKVLDGYKARNEISILKLSGWKDGRVLASVTLAGVNAPSLAEDRLISYLYAVWPPVIESTRRQFIVSDSTQGS